MEQNKILSKRQQKKLKKQAKLELELQKQKTQQKVQNKKKLEDQSESEQQNQQDNEQVLQDNRSSIDFNQLEHLENQQEQKIDVTFLIAEIREEYYHSMKTIFLKYGQIIGVTQSQIASQVLEKGSHGNVVVAEDDQGDQQQQEQEQQKQQQANDQLNVYSILTILPSSAKITGKVQKMALASIQKQTRFPQKNKSQLLQILKSPKNCALLVNTRLPNLPSFIISHSHEVFLSDIQEMKSKNSKAPIFQSEYILNVSEVEIVDQSLVLDDLIFSKFEDYEFCKKSLNWWVGQNIKSQRKKADLRKLYFVMKSKDYLSSVKNIKNYLQEDNINAQKIG